MARSWVEKDFIMKLSDADQPPKVPVFKNDAVKKRYLYAKSMAVDAVKLSMIERIEKYSFASLFTGKWGDGSEDSDAADMRTPHVDIDPRLVGIDELTPTPKKKTPEPKKTKRKIKKMKERRFRGSRGDGSLLYSPEPMFSCLKCSDSVKISRSLVENHLRRHRLSLHEYLDKYDTPDNAEKLTNVRMWIQNEDYMFKISGEVGHLTLLD